MSKKNEDSLVKSRPAGIFSQAAAIDVKLRNAAAEEKYATEFENPDHCQVVEAARAIVENYFEIKDIFENSRANRGKPFTVIKISNHVWPKVSFATKDRLLKAPLAELGLELQSTAANALLIRIYCTK